MRQRFFLLALFGLSFPATVGASLTAGCGPSIETQPPGSGGGGSSQGGGGQHTTSTSTSWKPDGGKDALPDYVDPGCPDAPPPEQLFECDPYNQNNGDCGPGDGCFIFVQYPTEPCGQETYGAVCVAAGTGAQGDPCGGGQDCQGGYVCVLSGSGNQCVQLCHIVGVSNCPDGLVCEPIDVEGFGGCL